MSSKQIIAYDTETTGLRLYDDGEVFAYSWLTGDGQKAVSRRDRDLQAFYSRLGEIWNGKNVVVMHNAKFDITGTRNLGIEIEDSHPFEDTMLMASVLLNGHAKGLKELCYQLSGYPVDDVEAVEKETGRAGGWEKCPASIMDEYQRRDAERTMLLFKFFRPKILADKEAYANYEMEKALIWPTLRMEEKGVMLRRRAALDLVSDLKDKIAEALADLPRWVTSRMGKDFRPIDLRKMLFEDLHLPVLKWTPKKGDPSTDKIVLGELLHRFPHCKQISAVMRHRSYSRGLGMIRSYIKQAGSDDVIHPSINTVAAPTGRESCESPNLQNVQKEAVLLNPFPVPARKVFRPRPGHVIVALDYSGIEMRLITHFSEDEEMIRVFEEKKDPHTEAAKIFYKFENWWEDADRERKKVLRGAMKNGHFAIAYGAASGKVADTLGLAPTWTSIALKTYRRRFPGIAGFAAKTAREVQKTGFVTTAFGHRLSINRDKAFMGANFKIQGTGAGIIKRAQIRVDAYFAEKTGRECAILFPVHDELLLEIPRSRLSRLPRMLQDIRELMIGFGGMFRVPLEIKAHISTVSWAVQKEVTI